MNNWTDEYSSIGLIALKPGDVIRIDKALHIVDFVNDCRARCIPLLARAVRVITRFGEAKEFSQRGNSVNVTAHMERNAILERRGIQGLKDFLATLKRYNGKNKQQQKGKDNMSTKSTLADKPIKNPRGGLAAEAKADREAAKGKKATKPERKVSPGEEFNGFTVQSCVRALAKAGVSTPDITAIAHARKWTGISDPQIIRNAAAARRGQGGDPAELTQADLKDLKGSIPATTGAKGAKKVGKPAKAPKVPKAPKAGKSAKAAEVAKDVTTVTVPA